MAQRLTPDDLHHIHTPEEIAEIFVKLGYDASADPLEIESLELPSRSADAIVEAYLLASHRQGNDAFQILLFQLHPEEFASYSLVRNRMKLIANSLCRRPAKYLLIATKDYQQLLLVSPKMELDKQWNLTVTVESCLLNFKEPSYQNRNWLEKLSARNKSPQLLLEEQQRSIKTISIAQQRPTESFTEDTVRMYLREIGRIPLLTASEEIELARRVIKFVELEQVRERLRKELQREPTNREWVAATSVPLLAYRVGKKAKDKLVQANLRLVVSIAKRYQGRGLELLDLIQEGNAGLIRATERFDPERGYKFSTYATWWIRQSCTRALCNQARLIRVPVHVYEKASQLKQATKRLSQQLGRRPTEAEIAAEMQIDLDKLQQIIRAFQTPSSLDLKVGENQETTLGELIESEERIEEWLENLSTREYLEERLNQLKPRDADIIKKRYGWDDGVERTLQEIGNIYKLTRERARQIEVKSTRKLLVLCTEETLDETRRSHSLKTALSEPPSPVKAARRVRGRSTSALATSQASSDTVNLAAVKIQEYFQSIKEE